MGSLLSWLEVQGEVGRIEGVVSLPHRVEAHDPGGPEFGLVVFVVVADETETGVERPEEVVDVFTARVVAIREQAVG